MLTTDELLNKEFKNWDPDNFNWEDDSWKLTVFCCDYFDIWWDSDRFKKSTNMFLKMIKSRIDIKLN